MSDTHSFSPPSLLAAAPRVIALANQKGGVGKTTTAINLGTALAAIGEEVLIVDLDPQGNASTGLGIDRKLRLRSTYDLMVGESILSEVAMETAVPRLSVAPSTMDLLGVELEIAGRSTDNPREPIVRINNIYAIKAAVERGTGIAILPDYMIGEGSPLVKLMPEAQVPSFPTYFCYPAELKNSARVTAFRDFMLAKAQNWQF